MRHSCNATANERNSFALPLPRIVLDLAAASAPAGWGIHEPTPSRWDRPALTKLCRERAPKPTRLVFTGPHGSPLTPIFYYFVSGVIDEHLFLGAVVSPVGLTKAQLLPKSVHLSLLGGLDLVELA
ncbi:DUF6177 family protein [Nocardiopsis composta]|uniref:DUF6177 family protein n=1 Tax=Nocardiopsis composta TaxID=157465 RepID=UPI001FE5F9E1|nr:DUF6177 family protein [Nocardiopsis composta]